jgi:hypothetical protein
MLYQYDGRHKSNKTSVSVFGVNYSDESVHRPKKSLNVYMSKLSLKKCIKLAQKCIKMYIFCHISKFYREVSLVRCRSVSLQKRGIHQNKAVISKISPKLVL